MVRSIQLVRRVSRAHAVVQAIGTQRQQVYRYLSSLPRLSLRACRSTGRPVVNLASMSREIGKDVDGLLAPA